MYAFGTCTEFFVLKGAYYVEVTELVLLELLHLDLHLHFTCIKFLYTCSFGTRRSVRQVVVGNAWKKKTYMYSMRVLPKTKEKRDTRKKQERRGERTYGENFCHTCISDSCDVL